MRGSEEGVSGTVLQRLMQEHLRYGAADTRMEENDMPSPSNPASTENLLLQDEGQPAPPYPGNGPQAQSRQEPQGQEHQVDSSAMEKSGGGSQGGCRAGQGAFSVPGHGEQGLPSYEEAKVQSQLYRGQQNQTVQQQQTPVHQTHLTLAPQVQSHSHAIHPIPAQPIPIHQSQQYRTEVHQPQVQQSGFPGVAFCSNISTGSSPPPLSPSLSSPPSLSSSPSSQPAVQVKARVEGRACVPRGCAGGAPLRDEGLAELKQGHVRSLSERIMQLSLERNGAWQSGEGRGATNPDESAPPGTDSATGFPSSNSTNKAAKLTLPPTPPPLPVSKGSADPRGPPPEYPFKPKAAALNPSPLPQEHMAHLYSDTLTAAIFEALPHSDIIRQYPIMPSGGGPHQQHHSPMSSQTSSLPGLPQTLLQPMSPAGPSSQGLAPRVAPLGQPFPGEPFAMLGRAQQMLEVLTEENRSLRLEMQGRSEKGSKLQRLEAEVCHLAEAHESLVRSSSKRESLDKTMRGKLEGEIRRLHDFNRDLRDRLETANRQLASKELEGQEDGYPYLSQRRESLKEIEKLEGEAASLRLANEDQRRHMEILEQALNNAQSKVVRLEEELGKKQVYVDRVERLQQALAQLQTACEKREQLERRLRTRLERELEALRMQQRAGFGVPGPLCESSAPVLLDLLREREERILGLEADMTRWEQKYLEESAMRHFAMEAAATAAAQRDTTLIQHSRSGSYSSGSLRAHDDEERAQSSRHCQDMEHRMKDLHAQLLEKDAMIKVLQQRSRKECVPLRPARSVPSISIATGLHTRQASQTDRKEENTWKGSANVLLLRKDSVEHLLPSFPSLSTSLSSSLPRTSLPSLPPSFPPLSPSNPLSSTMSSSSSSLPISSSSTLLPSSASSLPPLPPSSTSLPCTPLLSFHSKSASRDSSTQTGRSPETPRATPTPGWTRQGKTDSPVILVKPPEGRPQPSVGRRVQLPDADVVEILI